MRDPGTLADLLDQWRRAESALLAEDRGTASWVEARRRADKARQAFQDLIDEIEDEKREDSA